MPKLKISKTSYSRNVKDYLKVKNFRNQLSRIVINFDKKNKKINIVDCPFCKSKKKIKYFIISRIIYHKCLTCSSIYISKRPNLSGILDYYSYLNKNKILINNFPKKYKKKRIENIFLPRWNYIFNIFKKLNLKSKFDNYLEIGPGIGYFTEISIKKKISKNYWVVEPDLKVIKDLKKLNKNIKIFDGIFENYKIKSNKHDIIFINSVIEHPVNLDIFFANIKKVLKKNGIVVLFDMCADGFDVKMLREDTPNYNPYNILQVGSKNGILRFLKRHKLNLKYDYSSGDMDSDIFYEWLKFSNEKIFYEFKEIFENQSFRHEFQNILKKNNLTGYRTYIFTK